MFEEPWWRSNLYESPCNFSIKSYTEIFYVCYKGKVPSFHCKMSLDRSMSAGEVDGLSLILIDSYIPALTPRLHCIEAALQLSENIASLRSVAYIHVSSAKRASWTPGVWGVSFIYKLYSVGARTEPCGTPAFISLGVDSSPSTETLNFWWDRNE